jgi:hypothetical protein
MPPHLRYYEFESDPDLTLTIPEAENLIGENKKGRVSSAILAYQIGQPSDVRASLATRNTDRVRIAQ